MKSCAILILFTCKIMPLCQYDVNWILIQALDWSRLQSSGSSTLMKRLYFLCYEASRTHLAEWLMGIRGYATIKKVLRRIIWLTFHQNAVAFIEKKQQFLRGDASSAFFDWLAYELVKCNPTDSMLIQAYWCSGFRNSTRLMKAYETAVPFMSR